MLTVGGSGWWAQGDGDLLMDSSGAPLTTRGGLQEATGDVLETAFKGVLVINCNGSPNES